MRHLALVLALAATVGVAACSSSSSPASSTSSSAATSAAPSSAAPSSAAPSSAAPESTSGSAATAAITANWEAFFSGKTSAATKISLLQNGQSFGSIINAQSGSSLSNSASATVTSVTISGTSATVKYNIGVSGASLTNQTGTAVYENGQWKVGDVSFCGLLTLENGGTPPAVCKSAG